MNKKEKHYEPVSSSSSSSSSNLLTFAMSANFDGYSSMLNTASRCSSSSSSSPQSHSPSLSSSFKQDHSSSFLNSAKQDKQQQLEELIRLMQTNSGNNNRTNGLLPSNDCVTSSICNSNNSFSSQHENMGADFIEIQNGFKSKKVKVSHTKDEMANYFNQMIANIQNQTKLIKNGSSKSAALPKPTYTNIVWIK
jgi:hypothetical protein